MGPIHAEARVNADGIFVVEIAPRSIGGRCSRPVTPAGGLRLEEVILRHALRLPFDPTPSSMASGVMMIPIPVACGTLARQWRILNPSWQTLA